MKHRTNYTDVSRRIEASSWVEKDADAMAAEGWELVTFSVVQHFRGDGTPLEGAAVFAVYRRATDT